MANLHFELVTPEKLVRSDDVFMVVVPGTEGDFGVLADHASLSSGVMARRRDLADMTVAADLHDHSYLMTKKVASLSL